MAGKWTELEAPGFLAHCVGLIFRRQERFIQYLRILWVSLASYFLPTQSSFIGRSLLPSSWEGLRVVTQEVLINAC